MSLFVLLSACHAYSQEKMITEHAVYGAYNPPALALNSRLYYQISSATANSDIWNNSKVELGVRNLLTPTDEWCGIFCNYEPYPFFGISAVAGPYLIYTTFGYGFYSVAGPDSGFDNTAKTAIKAKDRVGVRAAITPSLRAKLNSIIFSYSYVCAYCDMFYSGYYIDPQSGAITKGCDSTQVQEVYLLNEFGNAIAGINYFVNKVSSSAYSSRKLSGVYIMKNVFEKDDNSYAMLQLGTHLKDRYLAGTMFISAALGVSFK